MLPGCQKRTKSLPKYSIYCREKPETTSLHCKFQDAKNFHSSLRKSKITCHQPTHPPHHTTFPKENQIPLTTEKEAKSSTIFAAAAAESRGQSSSPSVVRNIRTWISQTLFWSVTLNFCSF